MRKNFRYLISCLLAAVITVGVCMSCALADAPVITVQPQDMSAKNGKTVTTSVTAEGEGLTYQWYYKNANQTSFRKSSVTTATYSTKISTTSDGRQVYCLITNADGEKVKTDVVTVTKKVSVKITQQPQDMTAKNGKTVTTSVTAEGEGLTYQWYYKNANQTSFRRSSVTTATYSTKISTTSDGRQVYCLITAADGTKVKTDVVTVTKKVSIRITQQPQDMSAKTGKTVSTSVAAEGEGLTYQWYYKNANQTSFRKSSVTTAEYSAKVSSTSAGRQVYCQITAADGTKMKTDVVTITKIDPIVITKQPVDATAKMSKKATVTVEAEGEGLTYRWYFKDEGSSTFSRSSITGPTYSVALTEDRVGRQLYCRITDADGNVVKSDVATLKIGTALSLIMQPQGGSFAKNTPASTYVVANGDGLTYKWYYRNAGDMSFKVSSVTSDVYTTNMDDKSQGRQVYCVITDQYGDSVTTHVVKFVIEDTVFIATQPAESVTIMEGDIAAVTVWAYGDGLTYKWYYRKAGEKLFVEAETTGESFGVVMSKEFHNCEVYCVVTDSYGYSEKSTSSYLYMYDYTPILGLSLNLEQPPYVGQTLQLEIEPASATVEVEWFQLNTGKRLGDGMTYTVQPSDEGHVIVVKVIGTGNTEGAMTLEAPGVRLYPMEELLPFEGSVEIDSEVYPGWAVTQKNLKTNFALWTRHWYIDGVEVDGELSIRTDEYSAGAEIVLIIRPAEGYGYVGEIVSNTCVVLPKISE